MHATLTTGVLAAAALCAWSALLMHRGISTFNDGVRPLVAEWIRGNMPREDVARATRDLGRDFIFAESPFTVISALVLAWPILIGADMIGSALGSAALVVAAAALWGGGLTITAQAIYHGLGALPLDIIAATHTMVSTFLWGFTAIPLVACGYQFGVRGATVSVIVASAAGLIMSKVAQPATGGLSVTSWGSTAALIAGTMTLLVWALVVDTAAERAAGGTMDTVELPPSQTWRIRRNLAWHVMQGALIGLAARSFTMAWTQLDLVAIASRHQVEAGALALLLAFGYWPTIVTSAVSSGVYQSVGLCTAFGAAYFAPSVPLGALFGAIVFAIEILLLDRIYTLLNRFPSLRGAADSIRAAYGLVMPVAVTAGSVIAAGEMIPGGAGYFLVVTGVIVNEQTGRKLSPNAAPILFAVLVGLLANLLIGLGYMGSPRFA